MSNPFRAQDTIASRGRGGPGRSAGGGGASGPAAQTLPPALGDLLSWFDLTDLSTLWQDNAATIPAVDGQPVQRIDNKGNDPNVPFLNDNLQVGTIQPLLFANEPVPLTGALGFKTGGNSWNISVNTAPPFPGVGPAGGITVAYAGRQNDVAVASSGPGAGWGLPHFVIQDGDANNSPGNWIYRRASGTFEDSGVAAPVNIWNWELVTWTGTTMIMKVGGAAEVVKVVPAYAPINAGQSISIGGFRSQCTVFLMWAGALDAGERAAFGNFMDTTYGVMPF